MKPYRVLGYDADGFAWHVVDEHRGEADARAAYLDIRSSRSWMWTALAHVSGLIVKVLDTDAPRADQLHLVPSFYTPALFHGR